MRSPVIQQSSVEWRMISGRESILSQKPLLVALAKRCSQDGVLDFLDYWVSEPYFALRVPRLRRGVNTALAESLFMRRAKQPKMLLRRIASEVDAAVLLFEYKVHGLGTRCFIPFDEDGYRSVICSEENRAEVALQAGEFLIKGGGILALISYMAEDSSLAESACHRSGFLLGHRSRDIQRKLYVAGNFDDTLAGMSRNTRHNLRRSKRQLSRNFGGTYSCPDNLSAETLLELNSNSSFAAPSWAALERYEAARTLENGIVAGVKAADGRWLSVIGAHRESNTLCLDWQLNRSTAVNLSLATAMRALLIEDEAKKGTNWIRFERGTTHPIGHSFLKERVQDLVFAPSFFPASLIRSTFSGAKGGLLPTILGSRSLIWRC